MSFLWRGLHAKRRNDHGSEAIMPQPGIHYKSYGCANGWTKEPEVVGNCIDAKHPLESEVIVRDLVRYWCATCKITWSVVGSNAGMDVEF
jgi:hypothetical protein